MTKRDYMKQFQKLINELEEALLLVDKVSAQKILTQACDHLSPVEVADKIIFPVLQRIGQGWEKGTVALSQVYMSGRICEELAETLLSPRISEKPRQPKMAIVVLDDFHFLGKQIVISALRSSGFDVIDYGRLTEDELIQRICEDNIKVLMISSLMLATALHIKNLRQKLDEKKKDVKIIVGGAPFLFDKELWKEVGADAMAKGAADTIKLISHMAGAF